MKALATFVLTLCTMGSSAQTVYRCANTYSQEPCPQARIVDVSDARTDEQRAEGRQVAAINKRLSDEMRHERLAREAAQSKNSKPTRPKPAKRVRATPIKWFRP